MRVPNNGWFIKEIPIKMDDLGVPLFQETSNVMLLGKLLEHRSQVETVLKFRDSLKWYLKA